MNSLRSRLIPRHSISGKLVWMNLIVAAIALAFACSSFLIYDAYSFRQNLIHSLATESEIIGANSGSALTFDDPDSARTTLSGLRSSPDIVSALIVTPSGQPFAAYLRDSNSPEIVPSPIAEDKDIGSWKRGDHLLVASRIMLKGKPAGTVYIEADTLEIGRRIRRYVLIAALILVLCLLIALLFTSSSRRAIADPIADLADLAQSVTREQDFSLRARHSYERDEVGVLVRSFNEMLVQIQQRDRALLASRDELEERVQERTAELQAANKELEAFSYSVAHDLRGPLDLIGNTVFLIRQGNSEKLDPQTADMIAMLGPATDRMARLIDDLLNLSRSKSAALHREPIDLSRMAGEVVKDLRAADPDRKVNATIAPGLIAVADKGLMRVVLMNLLGNAWKYSAKTEVAHIEFGARRQRGETVFFVCDNGAGFDPALQDRLFQPFQRLHAQSDFTGTGIGLATVQRIISRHNGRVWAESEVGHGANFFFTLP
jgi:signal transduction histidine kinase